MDLENPRTDVFQGVAEIDEMFDLDPRVTVAPSPSDSSMMTCSTGCHTLSRTYCSGC
ncbi:FDLD family class I lanthipeptide [Pseudonocardia acaciae]|uniref:FDLD family class I lanthipeptide n=1 Tax=Pseudonocardia acaciae TaxID=551276 RepID=UPI001B805C30